MSLRDRILWLLDVGKNVGRVLAWVGVGLWLLHVTFTVCKGG